MVEINHNHHFTTTCEFHPANILLIVLIYNQKIICNLELCKDEISTCIYDGEYTQTPPQIKQLVSVGSAH